MPSEANGRLSLVVFSGSFERVHYALAMAAGALAIGAATTPEPERRYYYR